MTPFLVSSAQFGAFLKRHELQASLVPESNDLMLTSYLLLDENMCFLDCSDGGKVPSRSILEVGVEEALKSAGFDEGKFVKRGGMYQWSKTSCQGEPALEW